MTSREPTYPRAVSGELGRARPISGDESRANRRRRGAHAVGVAEEEVVEPLRVLVLEDVLALARELQPRRPGRRMVPARLLEQVAHDSGGRAAQRSRPAGRSQRGIKNL